MEHMSLDLQNARVHPPRFQNDAVLAYLQGTATFAYDQGSPALSRLTKEYH